MIAKSLSAIGLALGPAVANHLWQSTLFTFAAVFLALILRRNHARIRYGLWLAASLKFLLPLSLLIGLGGRLAATHDTTAQMQPSFYYAMDVASSPFTFASSPVTVPSFDPAKPAPRLVRHLPEVMTGAWLLGFVVVLGMWWRRWRTISAALADTAPAQGGRELQVLRGLESRLKSPKPLRLLVSDSALEPGIFGILRPVLVWPRGITNRLDDAQMEAIFAHEICHARRYDNLAAAAHMAVQTTFWFHPVVWWLGARLMDERERACDETVLRLCHEPQVYAQSILKACEFCVESPLPCVAGVTGADLKKRIVRIMTQSFSERLTISKRILLSVVAIGAITGPVVFGFVNVPKVGAQLLQAAPGKPLPSFEVASVKLSNSTDNRVSIRVSPGKFTTENLPLKSLIEFAYDIKSDTQISGGPDWINTARFNIDAKEDEAQAAEIQKLPPDQRQEPLRLMVQSLLAERFKLKISHETKELPVYALVVAKDGPKLTPSTAPPPPSSPPEGGDPSAQAKSQQMRRGIMMNGRGEMNGMGASISMLTNVLSRQREAGGRVVLDKTGLTGSYDWSLHWTPESPAPLFKGADNATSDGASASPTPTPDTSGPTLFTALQEQLGLKLESQKGSVETLVIDSVEKPSEN